MQEKREKAGLTQEQLAERLEVSVMTVQLINEDLKSDSNNNTDNEYNENFSTNEIDEEEIISDCYNVFNLTPEATEAEIKTAYKALIKKFPVNPFITNNLS